MPRLPRKSDARSYEVLHLSSKIILANLKISCSKMQPLSGNQRPDLLTSLVNMSFVLRLPRGMHLCRSSSNVPRLPSFLKLLQNPHVLLTFDKVHNPLRLPCKTTSERSKVLRAPQFFALLTSKCASHHNGVHFFDISTSKSVPELLYFVHFDFQICFAPQRRATFHLSSGQMAPQLRTRRFSEPTFRPSEATNHWKKHSGSRLSCLFARLHRLSSDSFSSLIFSLLLFSSLTLATSAFPSVHIVGSLTSKLPSNICEHFLN